jgi:hypothetical protein
MKILAIEKLVDDGESVWIDDGDEYKDIHIAPNNVQEVFSSFSKKNYNNYEHFIAVMGKFDPYTMFRKTPIEVDKLDYEEIVELRHSFEKEYRLESQK